MVNGVEPLHDRYRREPGLRERKKLKSMRQIQDTALRLFAEHGFAMVTIERVAAEADVSPSSVYRYFGTKEQLVLYDETDPDMMRKLDDVLGECEPAEALRRVLGALVEFLPGDETLMRSRMHLILTVPSVRRALSDEVSQAVWLLRRILGHHTRLDPDSLRLRVFVSALVHGFIAMIEYWHDTDYREPLSELIEETVTMLVDGFSLTPDGE